MWPVILAVVMAVVPLQETNGAILPDPECGMTKGCYPEACPVSGCTDFFVSWEEAGEYLRFVMTFEISAGDDQWVALAYSKDTHMGDSSVVMCRMEGGATSIEMGHTVGYAYRTLSNNYGLQNTAVNRIGTVVVCSFDRIKNATQNEAQVFDLDQPLHLLHAKGSITAGTPTYHSIRYVTTNTFDFLNVTQSTPVLTTPNTPTTEPPSGSVTFDPACGVTKGCFPDCKVSGCSFLVTWVTIDDQNIEFEISADVSAGSNNWVAIGFSADKKMGSDSIVACVSSGGVVSAQSGYNTKKSYGSLTPVDLGLSSVSGSMVNSVLNCKFTRMTNITGQSSFFDIRQKWRLFFAYGPFASGNLQRHSQNPIVSVGTVDFMSTDLQRGVNQAYILVQIHGSLMVVAWVLFSSIGIFVARYLKTMWPNSTVLGQKVWFQIHRLCMMTVFLFTAIAFVIIFVEVDGYADNVTVSDESHSFAKYHPILGIIVMSLTVMNPIIALLRCAPDHKKRPIFNFYHWFIGTSAHVLAAVTIVFATYLDKSNVPPSARYISISYICVFVFLDIVLEIYLRIRKNRKGRTLEVELKQQGDVAPDAPPSTGEEEGAPFAKVIFGIQMLSMFCFAVALIVLILKESED
ncbi:ferric-chelate reductase 1-like [Mizuhopecten yessoensis]|uniref:ferric-chelate reductase 1-like n=1 Tax=Mizuhopecten yessoensis TaxID=6573 RepID=UPI000B4581D4|nr:ferric-chelate reductase 1-like [Mizuhopecten yessoensis]XP_021366827.1 ferric-chelate reductase 1-like [Mizuhopecten yessoensis]XP_021366828.1 ferric-chelate reductase 1-like [Mizuhopecten yessoensis]